jgi:DNA-binding CsgD family transcriptional regulator
MNQLSQGVMLVDAEGRVGFANRYAERIFVSQDGLRLTPGGLKADLPDQTRRLRDLIAKAASAGAGNPAHSGGALTLERASGRRSLGVFVAPSVSVKMGIGARPAAVVFVTDPEQDISADAGQLEQLLELTPAEARLATALAQGQTVQEFAESAAVSLNTVRTHLKSIFSKTGVSRQSDLVRLILTIAPGLCKTA